MKGLFVDFDDSFSANIIKGFLDVGLDFDVVSYHSRWTEEALADYGYCILGPGPGHVDDYRSFASRFLPLFSCKKMIGICLGHQMIVNFFYGHKLVPMSHPLHGKRKKVLLSSFFGNQTVMVQFYNSWKTIGDEEEFEQFYTLDAKEKVTAGTISREKLTLQFHPESIGTSCPQSLFKYMRDFLYNT